MDDCLKIFEVIVLKIFHCLFNSLILGSGAVCSNTARRLPSAGAEGGRGVHPQSGATPHPDPTQTSQQ